MKKNEVKGCNMGESSKQWSRKLSGARDGKYVNKKNSGAKIMK